MAEVPFRNKPVMTYVTRVPESEDWPIIYGTLSARMANLTSKFSNKVIAFFSVIMLTAIAIYLMWQFFLYLATKKVYKEIDNAISFSTKNDAGKMIYCN